MSASEPTEVAHVVVEGRAPLAFTPCAPEDLSRLLFENSPDAIVITDDEGAFLDVNPAACALFGYSREQILLMRVGDFITPDAPGAAERYARYVETGKESGEFTFIRPDKEVCIASYSACRLAPGRHVSILRDVTERKHAEEALQASKERVRLATEAAGLGVWMWEPATDHVLWENERMYEIYGLSPADGPLTSARFMTEIVHPDDAQAFARAIATPVETGEPLYFAGRFRRKGGELRWIEFWGRLQPATKGAPLQVVGTAADITDRKQVEQTLQERAQEIEALNVRLTRSMKETHHRVKNNLQVISAMIEMQVLEHQGAGTVPLDEFERLKAHVHTLAIVHDLLTLSIKENEDAQRISIKVVLEKLLPMLQQMAWKQSVRYSVEEAEVTSKQCIALSLVLNELVSNALKHGRNQAEVFLTVGEESAILAVNDDGDGFPEGFDPHRAANTGLELVESLVRTDLQGTIRYANQPRSGGQVIVTFPLPEHEK